MKDLGVGTVDEVRTVWIGSHSEHLGIIVIRAGIWYTSGRLWNVVSGMLCYWFGGADSGVGGGADSDDVLCSLCSASIRSLARKTFD